MKIVVASKNPVKLKAAQSGFEISLKQNVELVGVSVESGVSDQPKTDDETLQGAKNRAKNAALNFPNMNYYVGIEGGIHQLNGELLAFAWVVVSDGKNYSNARTGSFTLPPEVARLISQGMELGDADDIVFKKKNSKQQNGAVGLLTNDLLTREKLYHQAVVLALIPFTNQQLYFDS